MAGREHIPHEASVMTRGNNLIWDYDRNWVKNKPTGLHRAEIVRFGSKQRRNWGRREIRRQLGEVEP